MERKPYEKALLWDDTINFSAEKFGRSSCGTGYSRTAEMKAPDPHYFSTIDSIDCELSVVSDRSGEKVKTVARIKIRTYTAIMPPTMKAIAFQTLFARLFLIASCSLIRESCSANALPLRFWSQAAGLPVPLKFPPALSAIRSRERKDLFPILRRSALRHSAFLNPVRKKRSTSENHQGNCVRRFGKSSSKWITTNRASDWTGWRLRHSRHRRICVPQGQLQCCPWLDVYW